MAVLGYHRVRGGTDPLKLSVSPANFEEHLAVIARTAHAMRLRDAVDAARRGTLPERAVVVTLDDGYSDNLDVALPLLERYQVPATVFVVTGTRGGEFWWDEMVRRMGLASASAQAPVEGRGGERSRGDRRAAALARKLERLPPERRRRELDALDGAAERAALPLHRSLTIEELERLARHPLVEIGSHTVSHPRLAELSEDAQRLELTESRAALEAVTNAEVASFAYPHGSWSRTTLALVREAGYAVACASTERVATGASNVLALPRLWPGNGGGDDFGRWLDGWIGR